MPVAPTYPGVYVEEIPSGVRTITGVATSVTAFIGRALRGPTDEPVIINNYGDYERIFGGLWVDSSMSFAVRDFYLNGGSQAIIVRLYEDPASGQAKADLDAGGATNTIELEAAYPGAWGTNLEVTIDTEVNTDLPDDTSLFNLTITDTATGAFETHRNVSILAGNLRQVDLVLEQESSLMRVRTPLNLPGARPDAGTFTNTTPGSDGEELDVNNFINGTKQADKEGLYALEKADIFNLLVIPPHLSNGDVDGGVITAAEAYVKTRRAFYIIDPPAGWTTKELAKTGVDSLPTSDHAAVFFPRIRQQNPLRENRLEDFAPSGAIAGVMSRIDSTRGIWKAPAGLEATLNNVPALSLDLSDPENGELNQKGVNCLRNKPPAGRIVWGSRTLEGDDRLASEWKYIPVRRLALFIEESLFRGNQWVVFEPNDEPLWAQIRLNVGSFMAELFRQGAFQGSRPSDAYFVKVDSETTTQNDIDRGIVNIVVGFAPLKPAEFVILKIQQIAGQTA